MKEFHQLVVGDTIKPNKMIKDDQVRTWKYGKECSTVGGGMLPHAELKVVDICKVNDLWLLAEFGGSYGTRHLKITPYEYIQHFVSF